MSFNIGVNVLEVEGTAAPTIVAAPVSTAGFLIRSERGVPDRPVRVRGFGDFVASFGSYRTNLFGAHALYGFFQNGGAEAWVSRVVGTATPAVATLNSSGGAPVLDLRAGMSGQTDPGEWGNSLSVRVDDSPRGTTRLPAQILSSNAEPFALVDNSGLAIAVDGTTTVNVRFRTADFADITQATASEVAAVIDPASPALRAVATPGRRVLLTSATTGTTSRVGVSAPGGALTDASALLGFTGANADSDQGITAANSTLVGVQSPAGFEPGSAVGIETRGRIVAANPIGATPPAFPAGIDVSVDGGTAVPVRFAASDFAAAPTTTEILTALRRQAAGFLVDQTADGRLLLASSTWGSASTIAIAAPPAATTDATAWLGFTGATAAGGTRETKVITSVLEGDRLVTWATPLSAALQPGLARLRTLEFRLSVLRAGATPPVEVWDGLSLQEDVPNYAVKVLNDPDVGSRYLVATDRNPSAPGVKADPAPGATQLALGAETAPGDTAWVGDASARTGLFAFDTLRIQLLACPETQAPSVVTAALAYCENRGDAMFVGTAPRGIDAGAIKTYAGPFRAKKVYGALYSPWLQITDPLGATGGSPLLVPPVGHVLGVYARIAASGGVWRAPAGDDAVVNLALGVEFPMTDADLTDLVENGSVNGIRAVPGSGIVIDSSRTLSTDTRWRYVNVRRLFNFVKVSLRDGLRFAAQEPNDDALRRRVKFNVVMPFLLGLWSQGAFGSDPAEQVFTIKCDATNNPPAQVQQGVFTLEVFFYPVKPAEKIIITVGQQDSGATANET